MMRNFISFIILPFLIFRMAIYVGPVVAPYLHSKTVNDQDDSLARTILHPHAVFNNDFCRKVFYTWTVKTQIDELRKSGQLIVKSRSEKNGYSLYDASIRDTVLDKYPLAKVLQGEQFSKKRFAWPNAWATMMGWEDEKYGDHLIRIQLKDDAIIGYLNLMDLSGRLKFFDLNGKELMNAEVFLEKERIAAIYHVNERKAKVTFRKGTYSSGPKRQEVDAPFREFVIINESMISKWEYGTQNVLNELKEEQDVLEKVNKIADKKYLGDNCFSWYNVNSWELKNFADGANEAYYSNIAFFNDYYLFNSKKIKAIAQKLQSVRGTQGAPFEK